MPLAGWSCGVSASLANDAEKAVDEDVATKVYRRGPLQVWRQWRYGAVMSPGEILYTCREFNASGHPR